MSDPFSRMMDSLYASELARPGRYYPVDGTPPFDIRVMKREPDEMSARFDLGAVTGRILLAVRQSEVARPAEGDTMTRLATAAGPNGPSGEELYDVLSWTADDERLEWLLTVSARS